MRNIESDLYVLKERAQYNFFANIEVAKPIYRNTNERLREILINFDFTGKEVLSVMASADQPFSAYYLGAKNVDTFDTNWVQYYFYYLKKWYLMYYRKAIFKWQTKRDLVKVLDLYDKTSEDECFAYELWSRLFKYSIWGINNLFLKECGDFVWDIPYEKDVDKLVSIIKDKRANYQEIDITKPYESDKKYDIVILSNIMESIYPSESRNQILCENLKRILNENGIVINSILNDVTGQLRREREEFSPYFDYEISHIEGYNSNSGYNEPLYYTYRRK